MVPVTLHVRFEGRKLRFVFGRAIFDHSGRLLPVYVYKYMYMYICICICIYVRVRVGNWRFFDLSGAAFPYGFTFFGARPPVHFGVLELTGTKKKASLIGK